MSAVKKSLVGMVRYQAAAYLDGDKKEFKKLTNFVNSYKSKLLIGNCRIVNTLGIPKEEQARPATGGLAERKTLKDIEQEPGNLPLTTEQIKQTKNQEEKDMTLDYDIF